MKWFATTLLAFSASVVNAAEPLQYNRDVRPILADMCFACHGPDSAARKADLRLDKRDMAMSSKAILPGDPGQSEVIRRILSSDPDEVMPPASTKKVLTASQKQTLQRWVQEGAIYEPHWSLITPAKPELPAAKNAGWVRNPIDRFVLARLEAEGLSPAPEADKRTLARRLSLDLTGLPPQPDIVDAFVNNASPEAYEMLVDTLLKSPQWGEHRARYWLDAARYADTHGIHFDNFREVWAYRDWVINAYNQNMPFDQFTIEQLAGDLLPEATLEQKIASGFNRCNITTSEGGTIPEEYYVLYTRDRTETAAQIWMAISAGCATCHDHKFDPLTQREFYEMSAFFNNTTQNAMDGNVKDTPPIVTVPAAADRMRFGQMDGLIAAAKKAVEDRKQSGRPEFDRWLAEVKPETATVSLPESGLQFRLPLDEGQGDTLKYFVPGESRESKLTKPVDWKPGQTGAKAINLNQGGPAEFPTVGDFDKDQPFSCGAWVQLPANDGAGAIVARMDDGNDYRGWDLWVEGRRIGTHIIHKWQDDALKVVSQNQVKANEWAHVLVTYDGSQKAAGVKVYINGELQKTNVQADGLKNTTKTTVPFKLGQRHNSSPLPGVTINDVRVYDRALTDAEVAALAKTSRFAALLAKAADQRTPDENNELYQWWLTAKDQPYQSAVADVQKLERELTEIKGRGTIAHIMNEKADPAMAFILFRGEYDKRRDQVSADTPDALPPFPQDAPRNRLGFAKWLLSPQHPLTARVTVNRSWQELFGQGLVRTAGDFGVAGELPSHPELLDWLAIDFREHGWDIKRFYKQLVMSATYRQSAVNTKDKLEKDPSNRLLARGPRFRMDAEMVRDYALAASGLLVGKIGGPSVKPYQPDGVWEAVAMIGSNTRDYRADKGENLYRRSMYTFWKRSAPPASMDIFNAPAREVCTVRRERTNTPLQALVTLNDPQMVEAAKALAQRTIKEAKPNNVDRVDFLARRLISRPLRAEEQAIVQQSLADLAAYYHAHPDDAKALLGVGEMAIDASMNAPELAAWTMLANELMNLDEVLNK